MKLPLLLSSQPEPWLLLYADAHEQPAVPLCGSDPPSPPTTSSSSFILVAACFDFLELEFFLVLFCPSGDRLPFRMDACWMEGGGSLASATDGRGRRFLRRCQGPPPPPCVVVGLSCVSPVSKTV